MGKRGKFVGFKYDVRSSTRKIVKSHKIPVQINKGSMWYKYMYVWKTWYDLCSSKEIVIKKL